jgi:hypothetical protein
MKDTEKIHLPPLSEKYQGHLFGPIHSSNELVLEHGVGMMVVSILLRTQMMEYTQLLARMTEKLQFGQ